MSAFHIVHLPLAPAADDCIRRREAVASPGMGHWGTCPPPLEFDARSIFLATRSVLWPKICRICDSGRGSAPDLAGGAHDALPNPVVGCGADTFPHTPPRSAPQCSRLRRLDRRAPWHQILATPLPRGAIRRIEWRCGHMPNKLGYLGHLLGCIDMQNIWCGSLLHMQRSVICLCVRLRLDHDNVSYKNGWTDQDAVWGVWIRGPQVCSTWCVHLRHLTNTTE